MSRRTVLTAFFALALQTMSVPARGATPVKEVQVVGPRVHLADVVPTIPAALATADLGPAPAPGGSRFVTQQELKTAANGASAKVLSTLPPAVRVVRKMKKLSASDLERETRKAVIAAGLRKGITIAAVRAPKSTDIAEGYTAVTASIPKPPRRTGRIPTTAALTFTRGTEILARVAVPIDLDLAAEAAVPDTAKGAAVVVTVKAGLVEISANGLASADADVGDELLITLRPSGKVLRATLIAPGKAVVLATPSAPPPATDSPSPSPTVSPVPSAPVTVPSPVAPPPANTAAPSNSTSPGNTAAPSNSTSPGNTTAPQPPLAPPAPSIAPPAPPVVPAAPTLRPAASPARASFAPSRSSIFPPRASVAPPRPSIAPSLGSLVPSRASIPPGDIA